jgi:hypothetical protein
MAILKSPHTSGTVRYLSHSADELYLNTFADPREYCISTKEFVVDDGKLKGLNTGTFELFFIPFVVHHAFAISIC